MSTNDDEAARKARARQIRQEIKKLKAPPPRDSEPEEESPAPRPKSPRDLIHDKMRELDEDKGKHS